MDAHVEVSEDKPEDDPDSPLSFSMEGTADNPSSALISRFWAPGWNSVSSLNKFQDEIGGHLQGGDPGVLLLKTEGEPEASYYNHVPAPAEIGSGELLVVPLPHIFGSEEWSSRCKGIIKRGPGPHLLLNAEDAKKAGLEEGDLTKVSIEQMELTLPVQHSETLPTGTAGLTPGLPGLKGIPLPATAKWST
jgi:NADH-quinone oxidoreductase subunit G